MNNILLTGATGTIGSVLSSKLQKKYNVIEFNRSSYGNLNNFSIDDIKDFIHKHNIDTVLHYAANPLVKNSNFESIQENLNMSMKLFDAASESICVETIGFASSILASLINSARYNKENHSLYASNKLYLDQYLKYRANEYNKKYFCFRHCAQIAPNATHGVFIDIYNKLMLAIYENSNTIKCLTDTSKPYMYIDDTVDYVFKFLTKKNNTAGIKHICYNPKYYNISVSNIVGIFNLLLNTHIKPKFTYQSWVGDFNIYSSFNMPYCRCSEVNYLKFYQNKIKLFLNEKGHNV